MPSTKIVDVITRDNNKSSLVYDSDYEVIHLGNDILYLGSVVDGRLDGTGELRWPGGNIYQGGFKNNKPNGIGQFRWSNGQEYNGEVQNGYRNGFGTLISQLFTVAGEWKAGYLNGKAKMSLRDGAGEYDGNWEYGVRTGNGVVKYKSGNVYHGQLINGVRNGKGKMIWAKLKQSYEGEWKNGKPDGHGEYFWDVEVDNTVGPHKYIGSWKNGVREGNGTFYYADGSQYTGEFHQNRKHGKGTFVGWKGLVLHGRWNWDRFEEGFNDDMFHLRVDNLISKKDKQRICDDLNLLVSNNLGFLHSLYLRYAENIDGYKILRKAHLWKFLDDYQFDSMCLNEVDVDSSFALEYKNHPLYHDIYDKPFDFKVQIRFADFISYLVHVANQLFPSETLVDSTFVEIAGSLAKLIETMKTTNTTTTSSRSINEKVINAYENEFEELKDPDSTVSIRKVIIKLKQLNESVRTEDLTTFVIRLYPFCNISGSVDLRKKLTIYQYAKIRDYSCK